MDDKQTLVLITNIITAVEKLVPEYLVNEADRRLNDGNSALCLIEETGEVHGKMFGQDKIRLRQCFRTAWTKASQVWITGLKTGEFEKRVYSGQLDDRPFGIIRPDFIGWEGGQPIAVDDKIRLSAGYSGFRGTSDLEIVQRAVKTILEKL